MSTFSKLFVNFAVESLTASLNISVIGRVLISYQLVFVMIHKIAENRDLTNFLQSSFLN